MAKQKIASWLRDKLNNGHEDLEWLDESSGLFKLRWKHGVAPKIAIDWNTYKKSADSAHVKDAKHKFKMAIDNGCGKVRFLVEDDESEVLERFSLQKSEWKILQFRDTRDGGATAVDKKKCAQRKTSREYKMSPVDFSRDSGIECPSEYVNPATPMIGSDDHIPRTVAELYDNSSAVRATNIEFTPTSQRSADAVASKNKPKPEQYNPPSNKASYPTNVLCTNRVEDYINDSEARCREFAESNELNCVTQSAQFACFCEARCDSNMSSTEAFIRGIAAPAAAGERGGTPPCLLPDTAVAHNHAARSHAETEDSFEGGVSMSDLMSGSSTEMRDALVAGDFQRYEIVDAARRGNLTECVLPLSIDDKGNEFAVLSTCEDRYVMSSMVVGHCILAGTESRHKSINLYNKKISIQSLVIVPSEQHHLGQLARTIIESFMKPTSKVLPAGIIVECGDNGDIYVTRTTTCRVFCRNLWLRSTPETFKVERDWPTLIFSLSEYEKHFQFDSGVRPDVELDIGNDFTLQSHLKVSIISRRAHEMYRQGRQEKLAQAAASANPHYAPVVDDISMESVERSLNDMTVSG